MTRYRDVEIEIDKVWLSITVEVYADRRERPDGWWSLHSINVIDDHDDITHLLEHFSSRGKWYAFDELMDTVDEALVEQEAMV